MENKKFNSMELRVFNLIREGKSRDEIATSGITTSSNLNAILAGIYEKTDDLVGYHSARSKFKELQGFLRNNPNVFSPIPDKAPEFSDVPPYTPLAAISYPKTPVTPDEVFGKNKSENMTKERQDVREIIKKLNEQYKRALEVNKTKLSVLDDIEKELTEGA